MTVTEEFRAARDQLVGAQQDWERARRDFRWPRFTHFNFGFDWFDQVAKSPERSGQDALVIMEEDGSRLTRTFAQLREDSNRVANWLTSIGVRRGDRIILILGNQVELWETMLGAIKLGAVLIPTTTQMGPHDLQDRVGRAEASWIVGDSETLRKFTQVEGDYALIHVPGVYADRQAAVRPEVSGRTVHSYQEAYAASPELEQVVPTAADETMLLYFTSGTTSKPKLVEHTHTSYPVGHLSTLYWIGLEPGDVHLNVSSPGWAKHAWSNFFAPWIAEATIFLYNFSKFDAAALMRSMDDAGVTSFCAPPTVWRMLIKADLAQLKNPPRVTVSAGEPLNPEVIEQVQRAWGCTIRDGFGQTESSLQIANTPGRRVKFGAMGVPLPGFDVALIDPVSGEEAEEGEICLALDPRPVGLMKGYYGAEEKNAEVFRDGYYHTGDIASRDGNGVITYVGRADDVFKSSDYKVSPFELESVLIEHPAVVEAAIVPAPDELRLAVPKAYVTLASGWEPNEATAAEILQFALNKLAPYKRIRRIEFAELPKTISGKIRRVQLRQAEERRAEASEGLEGFGVEYREADLGLRRP
ncbi:MULTISPECIES: AMP-binding protein [unclassified Nesterenkonia]|uniref:AMP-binding protein n=1 Tax=unclassified Nesterenkonia TaxID=2629769 RepID=UPI001F4C7732|nr:MULTISPECIES: AMP-binding protein [unclassified Nesterenkonia]MCH8560694.1 AMP-binding protein [Nesterenkonia sp. DZ6]MCH8570802.1 AMP-binding protein [Nesterenkonia sp. AY15]